MPQSRVTISTPQVRKLRVTDLNDLHKITKQVSGRVNTEVQFYLIPNYIILPPKEDTIRRTDKRAMRVLSKWCHIAKEGYEKKQVLMKKFVSLTVTICNKFGESKTCTSWRLWEQKSANSRNTLEIKRTFPIWGHLFESIWRSNFDFNTDYLTSGIYSCSATKYCNLERINLIFRGFLPLLRGQIFCSRSKELN